MSQINVFAMVMAAAVALIASPASAQLAITYDGTVLPNDPQASGGGWFYNPQTGEAIAGQFTADSPTGFLSQHDVGSNFNIRGGGAPSEISVGQVVDSTMGWSGEIRVGNVTRGSTNGMSGVGNGVIFLMTDETGAGGQFGIRCNPIDCSSGSTIDIQLHKDNDGVQGGVEVLGLANGPDIYHKVRMERPAGTNDLNVDIQENTGTEHNFGTSVFSIFESHVIFGGANSGGEAEWDYVILNQPSTIGPLPPPATDFEWSASGTGIWTDNSSWTSSPNGHPNSPNHTATFGDLINGPTAAVTHDAVTVNRIQFTNSTNSYSISGLGSVQLSSTTTEAPTTPSVTVTGNHQFQVPVNLAANTDIDVASDSTLSFNNALNLNGNTLIKVGTGTLNVNNVLASGGGTLTCLEGNCGGNGTVGGNLNNIGGTISPGSSQGLSTGAAGQVPEPASVVLLGLGGMLLFASRYGIRDTGYGIRDTGYGIRDTGYGIRDTGCVMRDA